MADTADSKNLLRLFSMGRPLAPVYGAIMRLRARLYSKNILKSHQLPALVISVGNLSLGGTGKTPMVLYIAKLLIEHNRKPAIISRGYGGKSTDPVNIVANDLGLQRTAEECGDEPRLLAELLPGTVVATGKKRAQVGSYVLANYPVDTLIMDDGFQHLAVRRDINLVLFSSRALARDPFFLSPSRVLPGGPLREHPEALHRADCFLITGITDETSRSASAFKSMLKKTFPNKPVFLASHRPGEPFVLTGSSQDKNALDADTIRTESLFGFSGIADPESFHLLLERSGYSLAGFSAFNDHHHYTDEDLVRVAQEASSMGAGGLITTEKDQVKIASLTKTISMPIYVLPVSLEPDKTFAAFLLERISEHCSKANPGT